MIFGTPVYAGRVPNKVLPMIQGLFQGNDAFAVPVVTFGNRNYDNALIELRNELETIISYDCSRSVRSTACFYRSISNDAPR